MITVMTDYDSQTFWLYFNYNHKYVQLVKSIDGRKYHPELKCWSLPATPAQANAIDQTLRSRYTGDEGFNALLSTFNGTLDLKSSEPTPRCTETPSWRHQLIGIDLIEKRQAVYLAYAMGIGKTKTIIDACGVLGFNTILVLAPKSVVQEWPREFTKHGSSYGIRCVGLTKKSVAYRTKVARTALNMGRAAIVVNYEAAWHKPLKDLLLTQKWDLVVLDESTRIKEPKSKVSKFVHELAKHACRRVCLSGTPITNSPLDLWSQCKFLDVGLFGASFHAYKARYCVLGGFQDKQILSFRNLDDLNRRFGEIAHRVTKEECLDLPPTIDVVQEVELGSTAVKTYKAAEGQFQAQLEEGTITLPNVLVETLRLQQITGGVAKYDEKADVERIDTSKGDALKDILQDLPQTEPIVVFCRFRPDLQIVHEVSKECGRTSFELSGQRDQLKQWRAGENDATVLAVQIQAGGLGIDLTRSAYCVFYSLGASMGDYLQARARLDRHGQTRNVTFYHLLAQNNSRKTVDHRIYKILQRKEITADKVLASEIIKDYANDS